MAIVKCENTKCKYYDDGFYCTKFIVEMTDGMCDYWTEQKKLTKNLQEMSQQEIRRIVEEYTQYGIQFFDTEGNQIRSFDDINDLG